MATLTGKTPAATYKDLLKVASASDNAGLDGTLRTIEDGDATDSALQISTQGIKSTGTLEVATTSTLTGNTTVGGTLEVGSSQAIITPTNFGYGTQYKVLSIGTGASNTNIALNYNPSGNTCEQFNGTGQILIAHNKGILAPNSSNNDFIGVLRPVGTGVYFGGGTSGGELAGNGLTVLTSGYVGIGTTNPGAKLHTTKSSGNGYTTYLTSGINVDGSDNVLFIGCYDENTSNLLYIQSNTITPDGTNAHTRFVVKAGGNVGIGTDSPSAKLDVNGEVKVNGGIIFPATQVSSSNANTLDDYEEGTWTPTISGSTSGTVASGGRYGTYTKVGNLVTIWVTIVNPSATTISGNWQINLPFTCTPPNSEYWGGGITYSRYIPNSSSGTYLSVWGAGTSSNVNLLWNHSNNNTSESYYVTGNVSESMLLSFTLTFRTA